MLKALLSWGKHQAGACSSLVFPVRHSARGRQEHIWHAWARDGEGVPMLGTAEAVCSQAPLNTQPCYVVHPQLQRCAGTTVSPGPHMSKATCLIPTQLGLVCGSWRRERPQPFTGNMQDPGEGRRGLSEIHMPQGRGHVQAVPAVQLWERQAQTAFVSSPNAPKMSFVGKKKF